MSSGYNKTSGNIADKIKDCFSEKRNIIRFIIILLLIAIIIFCGIYIIKYYTNGKTNTKPYKNDVKSVVSGELPENPIKFKELKEKNSDIYAWINIPNTRVDYPIVQSTDKDDNYYLTHNIEHKAVTAGAIYTQRLNSKTFDDPNTVIYGHNMRNGSMFRDLRNFKNKEFFDTNKIIYIYMPGHILTYEIFSAYKYDDRHILNSFDFYDESVYAEYLKFATNPKSAVKNVRNDRTITTEDKIITLSTCTGYDNGRYLVQGVLINDERTK